MKAVLSAFVFLFYYWGGDCLRHCRKVEENGSSWREYAIIGVQACTEVVVLCLQKSYGRKLRLVEELYRELLKQTERARPNTVGTKRLTCTA
jgi:hypothetical protein